MTEGWVKQQSTGEKEPGYTSVIEWRGFLVSLADAHFDYPISAATIDDIVQARTGISKPYVVLIEHLRVLHIRAWGRITIEIQNLSFVEKAKTVLLHFILKLEGLKDQGSLNDEET